MSWRDKAAAIVAKGAGAAPTEPTKPGNGGFGGTGIAPFPATPANDPAASEARMARALAYLEAHPEAKRACFADVQSDSVHIVLTVALREPWGALEVLVKRERFDAMALMELSLRYGATSLFVPEH